MNYRNLWNTNREEFLEKRTKKGQNPEKETAEIFLMNELIRMLACISIVTVKKIQGQECAELAEKSWFMAESIEYMWNAEILNQQVRENVRKNIHQNLRRMRIYVSAKCSGRECKP